MLVTNCHSICSVFLISAISAFGTLIFSTALAQDPVPLEPPPEVPGVEVRRKASADEAIHIFQSRLKRNPGNTFMRTKLGVAYLRRARESDDQEDYGKAAAEFQTVLESSPNDVAARAYLASVWMARHEFQKALALSQNVFEEDIHCTHALATIGDAHLELGNYDEAESAFKQLQAASVPPVPEVLARLARLAELRGQTQRAIELLIKAREKEQELQSDDGNIAWYDSRIGELYFGCNQLEQAASHLQAALARVKNESGALLLLARVRAGQGRYDEAIALQERVVAKRPDFDLIGDLADLHALAGNRDQAKRLEIKSRSMVSAAAKVKSEARHLAIFLADRKLQLPLALKSAKRELNVRQDIFTYDVLAWVLLQSGQAEAAEKAINKAMVLGTKDAQIYFHAGMIAKELGKTDQARRYLDEALRMNPHFSYTSEQRMRKALAEL